MSKSTTMYDRALVIKLVLVSAGRVGGNGASAYLLASFLGCTPATIHNTINRWGERVGIQTIETTHWNGERKKLFVADTRNGQLLLDFMSEGIEK